MVIKAALNRLLKTKQQPPVFPKGSKFSKTEAKSLLEEAQSKVQEIESSTSKIKSQKDFGITPDVEIPTSIVAPNITLRTGSKKVKAPVSSKTKVDEYLSAEDKIIKQTDELSPKESEFFNYDKINAADDIIRSIEIVARQDKKAIKVHSRDVVTWKETNDLATLLNTSNENLVANLLKVRPGTAFNATELKATVKAMVGLHKRLRELSAILKTEGGDTTANAIEFAKHHATATAITRTFNGAKTEAGRSLNILNKRHKKVEHLT